MTQTHACPDCGTDLPSDAPEGLCPQCLLQSGLANGWRTPSKVSTGPLPVNFVPPAPAEIAPHFPHLEILELLGQGGMGAVYKARQKKLDRLVALKILPPAWGQDPAFAERFSREAKALARLNHPNIVAVHDFGESAGLFHFLMEYVGGASLRQRLLAGRIPPEECLKIIPQLCDALQYAHDEGIVHRDIKPENILLDRRGRVKIADFGLAKLLGRAPAGYTLTGSQQVMGTPHYMAPEQMEKPLTVDHRADIYSLGVVFYEMLTGELPLGRFAAPSCKTPIDARLDELVLRALAKEPQQRPQSAGELKREVEQASGPRPSPARRPAPRRQLLRFTLEGLYSGQITKIKGRLRLDDDALVAEYEAVRFHCSDLQTATSERRENRIPLDEILSITLEPRWCYSTLTISVTKMSALEGLPSTVLGQVRLFIAKRDLPVARQLVAAVCPPQTTDADSEGETPLDATGAPELEHVYLRVAGPSAGLLATAIVGVGFWAVMGVVAYVNEAPRHPPFRDVGGPGSFFLLCALVGSVVLALGGTIVRGALKLRRFESYEFVILATILAMLPWSPHYLIGVPVGVWALRILRRRDVKYAFVLNLRRSGVSWDGAVPLAPAPRPGTGPVRRKMRSVLHSFQTLFFSAPMVEPAPEAEPSIAPGSAVMTPPPVAHRHHTRPYHSLTWVLLGTLFLVFLMCLGLGTFYLARQSPPETATLKVTPTPQSSFRADPEHLADDAARALSLNAATKAQVGTIFRRLHEQYVALEEQHTAAKVDDLGRVRADIDSFAREVIGLEDQFWTELDKLLTDPQRTADRQGKNFPLALFPFGRGRSKVEIWRVGAVYHWQVSWAVTPIGTQGEAGEGPQLPKQLERFWKYVKKGAGPNR